MAKPTALDLARSMIRGKDEATLSVKQTQFIRDVCAREIRDIESANLKKADDFNAYRGACVGDSVWKEGGAYFISGEGNEVYVIYQPFPSGNSKIAKNDWR